MDNEIFDKLVESMTQMNEITSGERAPSREFVVDAVAVTAPVRWVARSCCSV